MSAIIIDLVKKPLSHGLSHNSTLLDTALGLFELAEVSELEKLGETGPLVASGGIESLYKAFFGRDTIRTSLDLIRYHPELAHRSILALAELQGTRYRQRGEEEPGKIHHEYRPKSDPIRKRLEQGFDIPYYGTIDATPNYVYLICAYALNDPGVLNEIVINKDGKKVNILDSLAQALNYIFTNIKQSPGGFLEWHRVTPRGHANQAWKDSFDSYQHAAGILANHQRPIAGIEVQGYMHNALRKAAELFHGFNIDPRQHKLPPIKKFELVRKHLSQNIIKYFWLPGDKYFAIGLDQHTAGKYHQLDIITSNPGHLLDTEIFHELKNGRYYLEALIKKLFSKELLSRVGVRTLSKKAKMYVPGSYHNGSVWPFDNGIIADGLRRYGYAVLANELEYRILRAINEVGHNAEFFRGDSEKKALINSKIVEAPMMDGHTFYLEQPPQVNQAWTLTRAYIIERRYAEDFFLKTKYRAKDKFERSILLDLKKRKELFTKPEL